MLDMSFNAYTQNMPFKAFGPNPGEIEIAVGQSGIAV
jgi:hypothetical protein